MNNWKICRFCIHYEEIASPGYETGSIFPGKGECFFNPPKLAAGDTDPTRPEVHATDCCHCFDLDGEKIDNWLTLLADLEKKEAEDDLSGPDAIIVCDECGVENGHNGLCSQFGHYIGLDLPVVKGDVLSAQTLKTIDADKGEGDT